MKDFVFCIVGKSQMTSVYYSISQWLAPILIEWCQHQQKKPLMKLPQWGVVLTLGIFILFYTYFFFYTYYMYYLYLIL